MNFKCRWIRLLLVGMASGTVGALVQGAELTLIEARGTWRFLSGHAEASAPDKTGWRVLGFDDTGWAARPAVFHYGEPGYTGTQLADMQGNYTSFFLRKLFLVMDPASVRDLSLRTLCDDGYVAWINGHYAGSFNPPAGATNFNSVAGASAVEPAAYLTDLLRPPAEYLVPGTNVLAIQVFNVSSGSSDILFDTALVAELSADAPPFVVSVLPAPGLVESLSQVTVSFSEAVTGVQASDLMFNEIGATEVSGSGAVYTFEFAAPPLGGVQVTWDPRTAIQTLALPARALDPTGPGMNWSYQLVSPAGPVLVEAHPPPEMTLRSVSEVTVTFDQAVQGIEARDLRVNGVSAVEVVGLGAGPYCFRFPPTTNGVAAVSWATDHQITGASPYAPPFAASGWSYYLDPQAQPAPLMITEILAENVVGLADEDGDQGDWIELHNPGPSAAELRGWGLTDDPGRPHQWVFPEVTIPAGGYLIVHASGKNRGSSLPGSPLHTNFKLGVDGEYLGLYSPDTPARAVSELSPGYGEQRPGFSYGQQPGGGWGYYAQATPGWANPLSSITNVVAEVHFNVARCTFNRPFDLWLNCSTPGVAIRYTVDGSTPTETTGLAYEKPIRMQRTMVVRAAAFKPRYLPSVVQTHTFLYFPSSRLRSGPVFSLVTDQHHLYGTSGIMEYAPRNTTMHGIAWERPVSFEYLTPDGEGSFQVDCGIRVAGGGYVRERYNYNSSELPWSKYSFRLYFRGDYGPGRLSHPIFPDTTVNSFDTITLRAGMNDVSNPLMRDEMVRQLAADVGQVSSRGTFGVLYLNGRAVGIYNPCERIDGDFLRTYHGGTNAWDLVGSMSELLEGDTVEWDRLRAFVNTHDLTTAVNYVEVSRSLDLVNFIDYLLPQIYADNDDWPHNNWRAARERVAGAQFRFYVWDAEWAFGYQGHAPSHDTIANQLSTTSPPWGSAEIQMIFNGLKASPEFRLLFADRVHRHLFNGGALTDSRVRARYEAVKARVAPMISGFDDTIGATWIPQRRPHLLNHLAAAGFLASANAPVFSQFGGRVPRGWELGMSAPAGAIYYTTNGTDPRVMFTGTVSPQARQYTAGVRLDQATQIKARTLQGNTWSAMTEARFEVGSLGAAIEFSEIMYNPAGGDAYEFLEILNPGTLPLDLGEFSLEGVDYRFPVGGSRLEAGQSLLLASSSDPVAFALRYPGISVAGFYEGSLANGGERLAVLDAAGMTMTAVNYDDGAPWPPAADGGGASLERIRWLGDPNDAASWQASGQWGGSPGTANAAVLEPLIVINEIMASGSTEVPPGNQNPDWIEIHNRGSISVDLNGWSLTTNDDPRRFVFPPSSVVQSDGYLVVWCDDDTTASGLHTGFGLDRRAETVALYDAERERADVMTYGPQVAGSTIGRVGEHREWALTEPTAGSPNEPALTGSAIDLTINEFLANPEAGEADWLELHNRNSERPVALADLWVAVGLNQNQYRYLGFVAPGGYVQLIADDGTDADHLGLRLPAAGGDLILREATGAEIDRIQYGPQAESVSYGRLPDGSSNWSEFPGTASPGAANYVLEWNGPVLNEFMARNRTTLMDPAGQWSDWLELFNPGSAAVDLGGMSLNVRQTVTGSWRFPSGSRIEPGAQLLIWCSDRTAGSTFFSPDMNMGASLSGEGGAIYLFSAAGQLVDSVEYGFQVDDMSAGRLQGEWGLMAEATPKSPNAALAELGDAAGIRFNEWLATSAFENDWFELYNPASLPVDLSGFYLTDNPSIASQTKHQIGSLTFIAPRGYIKWIADDHREAGPDHVNFSLDAAGEMVRLNTNALYQLDVLYVSPQIPGVTEGRLPDGAEWIVHFPESPTPGRSNYLPIPGLVINEVLSHTDPPLEDAIEIRNLRSEPVDIGGWYLSHDDQRRYPVPPGTVVPAGGFYVFYEHLFNAVPGTPGSFELSSAYGDVINLFETDGAGELTGRRATASFGPSANGDSFGRISTSQGTDYGPMAGRTFGIDQPVTLAEFRMGKGAENSAPRVGPVVLNELMYHPSLPIGFEEQESVLEYVELLNLADTEVALFDPQYPTNTWRLAGGVQFTFPPGIRLAGKELVLVVAFDPVTRPELDTALRMQYGMPASVTVLGPYEGTLSNAGERIELVRPDTPQGSQQPDVGYVPYLVMDQIEYGDHWPWPPEADGTGASLQRRAPHLYGNEPLNWMATLPTAGQSNLEPEDLDQDGLPDAWEEAHGLDPRVMADASWDGDEDGQSNFAEYLAGTDPRDPEDVLRLRFHADDQVQQVRFVAKPGRSYSLQYCDDLDWGVWLKAADVWPPEVVREVVLEIEEMPAARQRLYRVVMPAQP